MRNIVFCDISSVSNQRSFLGKTPRCAISGSSSGARGQRSSNIVARNERIAIFRREGSEIESQPDDFWYDRQTLGSESKKFSRISEPKGSKFEKRRKRAVCLSDENRNLRSEGESGVIILKK